MRWAVVRRLYDLRFGLNLHVLERLYVLLHTFFTPDSNSIMIRVLAVRLKYDNAGRDMARLCALDPERVSSVYIYQHASDQWKEACAMIAVP